MIIVAFIIAIAIVLMKNMKKDFRQVAPMSFSRTIWALVLQTNADLVQV